MIKFRRLIAVVVDTVLRLNYHGALGKIKAVSATANSIQEEKMIDSKSLQNLVKKYALGFVATALLAASLVWSSSAAAGSASVSIDSPTNAQTFELFSDGAAVPATINIGVEVSTSSHIDSVSVSVDGDNGTVNAFEYSDNNWYTINNLALSDNAASFGFSATLDAFGSSSYYYVGGSSDSTTVNIVINDLNTIDENDDGNPVPDENAIAAQLASTGTDGITHLTTAGTNGQQVSTYFESLLGTAPDIFIPITLSDGKLVDFLIMAPTLASLKSALPGDATLQSAFDAILMVTVSTNAADLTSDTSDDPSLVFSPSGFFARVVILLETAADVWVEHTTTLPASVDIDYMFDYFGGSAIPFASAYTLSVDRQAYGGGGPSFDVGAGNFQSNSSAWSLIASTGSGLTLVDSNAYMGTLPDVSSILAFDIQSIVYVDKNNAGTENGLSWATAFNTIQEGIDGALASSNEDFESGVLTSFTHTGDAFWTISSIYPNSGLNSAQAGSIGHNQSSSIEIDVAGIEGEIFFSHSVSSEAGFDYLRFYIDGVQKNAWSGPLGWQRTGYPVTAGNHTFKWSYTKDGAVSSGSDTAWIDDITYTTASLESAGVWVADGTYNEARTGDFSYPGSIIMKPNVSLYGGFDGTESVRSQRDWSTNVTVLDGSTSRSGSAAYHVVVGADNADLDGFSITGGSANGGSATLMSGGGLFSSSASFTLANSILTGNSASNYGGGMANWSSSSPFIVNSVFTANSAGLAGGGIHNNDLSTPTIVNTVFTENFGSLDAAAMYNSGGAAPVVFNSTFTRNTGGSVVGGFGIFSESDSPLVITNSILWDNSLLEVDSLADVTYSIVESGFLGAGNLISNPSFVDGVNGDLHLQEGSPAIDAGTANGAPSTDFEGNSRPQGVGIDMGAFEYPVSGSVETSATAEDARLNFDSYDTNDDGSLSSGEWSAAGLNAGHFAALGGGDGQVTMAELLDNSGLTSNSLSIVYVNFGLSEPGDGTSGSPLRTLREALGMVTYNGTGEIRLKPGDSFETFTFGAKIDPSGTVRLIWLTDGTSNRVRIGTTP